MIQYLALRRSAMNGVIEYKASKVEMPSYFITTPQGQTYRRNRRHIKRLPRPSTEWEEQTYLCGDDEYMSETPDLEQLANGTPQNGNQEATEPVHA